MQDKILSVFYGEDRLPYKDASRETHYPIVNGSVFNGANNVTKIRYYLDRIGGFENVTWVVVSKLPNGQLASEVLNSNNKVLDSELGEYYVEFEISSYYTTLNGDVYLSLQGYQGGVEMEQDDDTGIYSIYGTPTIQATGSIKIGVNYAPQTVPGPHFTTSDLQQVLGLISDKANISDTILVVDNIATTDLSDYNNGQLFYDKVTKLIYKNDIGELKYFDGSAIVNLGSQNFPQVVGNYIDISITNEQYSILDSSPNNMVRIDDDQDIHYFRKQAKTQGQIWVSINGTDLYTLAEYGDFGSYYLRLTYCGTITSKQYVYSNFVNLTGNQTITGQKTFSGKAIFNDANLYNGYITTNSKNYFVRVGVTTGQYVTYKLPSNYSDVGAVSLTLATEDYVDSAIADFLQNEYSKVNTTTYPTLDDFLASTGDEGYIYLYPIDPSDETKGYYQYIWENSAWVSLGTTQIDLSGYVEKTQTIAGIDLQDNISASELTDALVFMNNTTDLDYVMGE